ncbi:MAG: DUF3298 and DUF4163 domain-containing protein [Clostridia bacterium]|nr:DUF3298 and DUF4163 domain-containing protein [Clostridia bacterium]
MVFFSGLENSPVSSPVIINHPVVSQDEYNSENTDHKMTVRLYVPHIDGLSDKAVQSGINDRLLTYANKIKDDFAAWAKSDFENLSQGMEAYTHALTLSFEVKTLTESILSILITEDSYTGGPYPTSYNHGFTFNLNTGEEYLLSDLFKDDFDYVTAINSEIINSGNLFYGKDKAYDIDIPQFDSITENQNFYLNDMQLIIFYNEDEIAPHAVGYLEFYSDITLDISRF